MARFRAHAFLLLIGIAVSGCDSSANYVPDAGIDGGYAPTASCQGLPSECSCATAEDCTLSIYAQDVSRTEECFCLGSCAYNPVRVDGDAARQASFAQYCGEGNGIADGGCPNNNASCESFTTLCWQGTCAAQAVPPDAGS